MPTALVTGATGFIGHHICNRLCDDGFQVIAVGSKHENKPKCNTFLELTLDGITWDLMPPIDICFHQAANNDTTDRDRTNMLQANLSAGSNLFYRLVREKNCKKFVYASSSSVYGHQPAPYIENVTKFNPLTPYAESKVLFEQFAQEFALEYNAHVVGLRYTNVYGPGEKHKGKRASMIHQLLQTMLVGKNPQVFKYGEQQRDWVYIEDVVEANMLSSRYNSTGVFNVGSGVALSFNEMVDLLNEELGTALQPEYKDCPFQSAYQTYTLADLELGGKKLGYIPKYTPELGIRKFVQETKKAG
jgi:ADP-L-glycero-D-manno-heptose 6-epimerase